MEICIISVGNLFGYKDYFLMLGGSRVQVSLEKLVSVTRPNVSGFLIKILQCSNI